MPLSYPPAKIAQRFLPPPKGGGLRPPVIVLSPVETALRFPLPPKGASTLNMMLSLRVPNRNDVPTISETRHATSLLITTHSLPTHIVIRIFNSKFLIIHFLQTIFGYCPFSAALGIVQTSLSSALVCTKIDYCPR